MAMLMLILDCGRLQIGTVKILSVTKNSKAYFAHKGYFHWILQDPQKIVPFEIIGKMGWFKISIVVDE